MTRITTAVAVVPPDQIEPGNRVLFGGVWRTVRSVRITTERSTSYSNKCLVGVGWELGRGVKGTDPGEWHTATLGHLYTVEIEENEQ